MYGDLSLNALHAALRGLAQRQRTTADNIANVETPGFTAGRVDFEDALRSAIGQAAALDQPGLADAPASLDRSADPARLNGNNVNLDTETITDLDTGMRYQLMLRAVDGKFSLLRTSMRTTS